jgi:hypothetical protein
MMGKMLGTDGKTWRNTGKDGKHMENYGEI